MSEQNRTKLGAKRELAGRIQTCDICRLRHQKCNGAKPCYHCEARKLECKYTNIPTSKNKGRKAPKASTTSETAADRDSRRNDLVIQTIIQEEIASLPMSQSQSQELVERLTRRISRRAAPVQISPQSDMTRPVVVSARPQHLVNVLAQHLAHRTRQMPQKVLKELIIGVYSGPPLRLPTALHHDAPNEAMHTKERATSWIQSLLHGPNNLIGLLDARESLELLDRFYSADSITPVEECILTYQLALGARLADDTPEWVHYSLYDRARAQLERCIDSEEDDTWVIQAMLLSCMYLMNARPKIGRILIGTAIRIAQQHQIDLAFPDSSIQDKREYDRLRMIWRSIYYLDIWNSILIGCLPQLSATTTQDPFLRDMENDTVVPNQSLAHNTAMLAVITGKALSDIYTVNKMEPKMFEKHVQSLKNWAKSLPIDMQVIGNRETHGPQLLATVSSGYAELLYYASNMFITLPPLQYSLSGTHDLPMGLHFAALTCTESAMRIGKVTKALLSQGVFTKRSDMPMVLNFVAAIVLLLGLNIKDSGSKFDLDVTTPESKKPGMVEGLKTCIANLEEGASQDEHVKSLYQIAQALRDLMEMAGSPGEGSSGETSPLGLSTHMFSLQQQQVPPRSRDHSSSGSHSHPSFTPQGMYMPDTSQALNNTPTVGALGQPSHLQWPANSPYSPHVGPESISGLTPLHSGGILSNPYTPVTYMTDFQDEEPGGYVDGRFAHQVPYATSSGDMKSPLDERRASQYSNEYY